jgi:hypothetical protein
MRITRVVGRPRKTLNDLPANWKQLLLDSATIGGGRRDWQAILKIHNNTWDSWIKSIDEFKVTIEEVKIISQAWWEMQGRRLVNGSKGNGTIWAINMKNRFGWGYKKNASADDTESPWVKNDCFIVTATISQTEATQAYIAFCSREGDK